VEGLSKAKTRGTDNNIMDELELELNDDSNKIEAVVLRVETVRSQTKMRD
jgi:hypothetical protein